MIKLQSAFKEGVESWELSTPLQEASIVANGEYKGKSLLQYVEACGKEVLGTRYHSQKDTSNWMKMIEEACNQADLKEDQDLAWELEEGEMYKRTLLAHDIGLHVEVIDISEEIELVVDDTSFHSIIVLEGSSHMLSSREKLTLNKRDFVFLPAGYGTYCIVGTCKVIFSTTE